MTLSKLLKLMQQPYTAHGFRSSFRDWVSEETNHPSDVAEAALAHLVADKTEAAYRRGKLLAKRRIMMEDRSEEHTSELQVTNAHLVCRLLLEKKNKQNITKIGVTEMFTKTQE